MKTKTKIITDDGLVACPGCCEYDSCHPTMVSVNRGGNVLVIDSDGARENKTGEFPRGVVIKIRYQCESGHKFEHHFQFHKGVTLFKLNPVQGSVPYGEVGTCDWPKTIWRD